MEQLGKVAVFGILKRGGRVYTKMIPNTSRAVLMPIIKAKVKLDSVVYTDTYVTYDSLDVSGFHHHRINHRQAFAAKGGNHINGIEKLLEPDQASLAKIQRHSQAPLPSLPQRVRVALQLRTSLQALEHPQNLDQAFQIRAIS